MDKGSRILMWGVTLRQYKVNKGQRSRGGQRSIIYFVVESKQMEHGNRHFLQTPCRWNKFLLFCKLKSHDHQRLLCLQDFAKTLNCFHMDMISHMHNSMLPTSLKKHWPWWTIINVKLAPQLLQTEKDFKRDDYLETVCRTVYPVLREWECSLVS